MPLEGRLAQNVSRRQRPLPSWDSGSPEIGEDGKGNHPARNNQPSVKRHPMDPQAAGFNHPGRVASLAGPLGFDGCARERWWTKCVSWTVSGSGFVKK